MPLLASCVALFLLPPHSSISVRDITAKNQPARDVWVFRSVLDKHARIATLAIAPGYWLSYDATTCGIFKFWHGDVKFNGAVYTTVHGPQPTSEGGAFEEGSLENDVWKLAENGDTKLIKPQFRGYSFDLKDRTVVSFQYDLKVGGQNYEVFETPQLLWNSGKPVGLRRRFYVTLFSQGIAGRSVNHDKALSLKLGKSNGILKNFKITGGSYGLTKGFHECTDRKSVV